MSYTGHTFVSEKLRDICMTLNIEQAVSSSNYCESNGHVVACIKFIKHTLKKCSDTNAYKYQALLQIHTTYAKTTQSYNTIIQLPCRRHHASYEQITY